MLNRLAVILVTLAPALAWAGGVAPKRTLTFAELVAESQVVMTGSVAGVEHRTEKVEAYGQKLTVVTQYRLRVKIGEVLKAPAEWAELAGKTVLVTRHGDGPPNAWVVIDRFYPATYFLRDAKRGDEVLLLSEKASRSDGEVHVDEVETAKMCKEMAKVLKQKVRCR